MNSLSCNRRIVPGLRAHPESKRSSGFFSSARHARLRSLTVPLMGARVQVQRVSPDGTRGGQKQQSRTAVGPSALGVKLVSSGRYAGFASVISVGEGFVNGALAAAASSVKLPSFSLPDLVTIGSDEIGLSGSLLLAPPSVSFKANPSNLVDVTCGCTGTVRLTDNGASLIQVALSLTASLTVGFDVEVDAKSLAVRLDFSKSTVSSLDDAVTVGPPLPPTYEQAIKNSSVLDAFSSALQKIPPSATTFTIPGASGTIGASYGGVSASVVITRIVVVPLDGVLDIAADVSGFTSGDESSLENLIATPSPSPFYQNTDEFGNVTYGGDIFEAHSGFGVNVALALNGNFLCALVNGALATNLSGKTIKGVTIQSLSISLASVESEVSITSLPTLMYDSVQATLQGSYSNVSFTAVAAGTPISITIPSASWLEFAIVQFDLSVEGVPWWEYVFFPIAGLLGAAATSLVDTIANGIIDNLLASNGTTFGISLSGVQAFPGAPGWNISFSVVGAVVWAAASEIDVYAAASVTGPAAAPPRPLFKLTSLGKALTDPTPISVTLSVADDSLFDALLGLRIGWTAMREDTGAQVLNQDSPLTSSIATVEIDRWTDTLKFNDTWSVSCEVYRPADKLIPRYTYFTGSIDAGVSDLIDRHHPYVRWSHSAGFHDPVGPGPLKQHRIWTRNRHSRIHRTDVLIRCLRLQTDRFVVWHDEVLPGLGPLGDGGNIEYLDSLSSFGTFENVADWRHGTLCDYCFFGGPTKTEWRTPTLPTKPWE